VRALEATGRPVIATPENENNEIGVAKFLLSLDDGDERVAIVEFGARKYRDLDPLVRAARPDIGVLTNIGEAHLAIMGSRERLAETKWGLFGGGARAVLNLADDVSRAMASALSEPPVWFGIDAERPAEGTRAVIVRVDDVLAIERGEIRALPLHVDVPGDYNRRNLAAALAAAWLAGADPAAVTGAAPHFDLPHGRYERMRIAGGPTIIFDAYNASMSGAQATLATFARERVPGRRIVVLGSMAELGDESALMHQRVGAAAAASADIVLVGGDFAASLAVGTQAMGLAPDALITYQTNEEAIAWLREHARPDDFVLLKGSRMYRMEQIVAGLSA
jgi:UDP-N-acetylmuramoyl-tripeptide--D-alanyl-D-alanine ligase